MADGRGYVYVLPAAGAEDLLKVGATADPLARWSAFHPRWFQAFDLERGLLVETETRRDAQRLETQWHRALRAHRCPMPMTIRMAAGGQTEWYRGAYAATAEFADRCRTLGHTIHSDVPAWLAPRMREQQARLFELLQQAASDHFAGWLAPAQRVALRDLVEAHCCFDPSVRERLPESALSVLALLE